MSVNSALLLSRARLVLIPYVCCASLTCLSCTVSSKYKKGWKQRERTWGQSIRASTCRRTMRAPASLVYLRPGVLLGCTQLLCLLSSLIATDRSRVGAFISASNSMKTAPSPLAYHHSASALATLCLPCNGVLFSLLPSVRFLPFPPTHAPDDRPTSIPT